MCGIAGILVANGGDPARDDLLRMTRSIAHRGPDGEGLWIGAGCGLGHRRLAIIDIDARADQPMLSAEGRYAVVFNGEIYNFIEIKGELERKGHRFRTESDTEVVLAAWQEWGEAMLPRFNGMWALAIFDTLERTLVLARDRYGVKPLLYSRAGNTFAFASEPRALRALPWIDSAYDMEVVRRGVMDPFGVEASDRSIYLAIRKLPAGHIARVSQGEVRVKRWWNSAQELIDPPKTLEAAAEGFRERFYDSVRIRMRSDVPIGTCLSGGFDSSSIAAAMRHIAEDGAIVHDRESQSWRHAFVASFPGMSNDETVEAKIAARYAGITNPSIFDFSQDLPTEHIDAVLDTMEEPFITLPTAAWKIYQRVEQAGVRVSLDGHGADELMGGYRQGGQRLRFLIGNLLGNVNRGGALGAFNNRLKIARLKAGGNYFLRDGAPARLPTYADADILPASWGVFNRRLYSMMHATVLPTLLRNFDRLSMAHSVEVRSPYLDWRVVQYVLSLPDEMKSNETYSKLVARQGLKGWMPEEIRTAKRKVGFGSQKPEWMNGALGQWAERLVASRIDGFDEIVDQRALHAAIATCNGAQAWTWEKVGRVWPYIQLAWMFGRTPSA